MAPRSTRSSKTSENAKLTPAQSKVNTPRSNGTRRSRKRKATNVIESDGIGDDSEEFQEDDDDTVSLHSDALDDSDVDSKTLPVQKRKRGSESPQKKPKGSPKKQSPRKKTKVVREEEEEEEDDFELGEGQEIVGDVVEAPKTGRVPPGQISQNTFHFLSQLRKPECNDREWFKLHEAVYRLAEQEWKDFIEAFTTLLIKEDAQIPPLPPKDVIHRIYRDVRFSNDKTPYKTGLSASFSRSGRKGIFAGYHVAIRPGGESLMAAGTWCPGKNELATIRHNLLRSSTRLRKIISAPDFVHYFGEAKPHPKGARQNVFGMEDELKVAPKGVLKTHKNIDLLKCRSYAVVYKFTDVQVLSEDFKRELCKVVNVVRPFVHYINDLMTLQNAGNDPDSDDDSAEVDEDGNEVGEDEED